MTCVAKAKPRYARRYDMETLRVLVVGRVRQWLDNLRYFQDTAWPAMTEEQRNSMWFRRPLVNEMYAMWWMQCQI